MLAAEPDLRARLRIFEQTRAPLAEAFEPVRRAPLPDRLVRVVREGGRGRESESARRTRANRSEAARVSGFLARATALLMPHGVPGFAALATILLMLGVGLGWWMATGVEVDGNAGLERRKGDAMRSVVALEKGTLVARGHLALALESVKSGTRLVWASGDGDKLAIRPKLTFRDMKGRYCREYEMAATGEGYFSGVACRTGGADGTWRLLVHAQGMRNGDRNVRSALLEEARPGSGKPAGRPQPDPAIDAVIEGVRAGDPLGKEEEARAMARKWAVEMAPAGER